MKIWIRLSAVAALVALAGCETPPAAPPAPAPAPATPRPAPARPAPSPGTGSATPTAPGPAANPSASSPGTPAGSVATPATKSAAGDSLLKEGIAAYENGDFGLAIRKLGAPELYDGTTPDTQLQARKYLAFSYCVSGRRPQCRQQFDLALRASPSFDLSAAEAGHPIWGPVFKQAKAAAGVRRP